MLFLCPLIKLIIKLIKITHIIFMVIFLVITFNLIWLRFVYADNLKEIINTTSDNYRIPSELIYRVIEVESSFNPYAQSLADARGLMQITRPTWDWICRDFLQVSWSFDEDSFNCEKNIIVGTRFLAWIKDYLHKHENELNAEQDDLLLACYNAGPGTVKKYGFRVPPFEETQIYVAKINKILSH
ncbi:MAG: lytic transglycosylase domain-containing protein [Candidatus Omnitrophica bacterium]|nr:lytic transglycosylase domain-containing protein [Candidatus Omnitrophota bacterium]